MKNSDFTPPKNLQYLMLIVNQLKEVRGRVKLFKIHYLIEKEGLVKFDMPIHTYPLGPVDYASFNFCMANNLFGEGLAPSLPYNYYKITLTEEGKKFFRASCLPNMNKKEIDEALRIINKYGVQPGTAILSYVHKKYVDPFKKPEALKYIDDFGKKVSIHSFLVTKEIEKGADADQQYVLLGELHHVGKILSVLKKVEDAGKIGTILWTIYDMLKSIEVNQYRNNPYTTELFEFLDNYCEKEGIHRSISSDDFSDIPEGERERLLKAVAQLEIPPYF